MSYNIVAKIACNMWIIFLISNNLNLNVKIVANSFSLIILYRYRGITGKLLKFIRN